MPVESNTIQAKAAQQPHPVRPAVAAADTRTRAAWERLAGSAAVRQYREAFARATGLPLSTVPAEVSTECLCAALSAVSFCAMIARGGCSGELCRRVMSAAHLRAGQRAVPVQHRCFSGLREIFVPVIIGGRHAGSLLVGPFFERPPTRQEFALVGTAMKEMVRESDLHRFRAAYLRAPVMAREKADAVVTLAAAFAQYLGECGGRLVLEEARRRSPLVQRIDHYIAEHADGPLSLAKVAAHVNVSPGHLCRLFKRDTNLTLTEYWTRVRVEKAKQLLANRHLRVSEVSFQAGFESIPYFNRVFRRHEGCSPSQYRSRHGLPMEDKKL
ncbi:MAG: helix-turn-helix domain-containing protein [Verrucomicrobia bacterium]|nr:helix-turn-helix domain-containing protein [Verrucomicrobiota bacterium]